MPRARELVLTHDAVAVHGVEVELCWVDDEMIVQVLWIGQAFEDPAARVERYLNLAAITYACPRLRSLRQVKSGPRFPEGFDGVSAEVIYRPPGAYAQTIVIAAGREDGIRVDDPVVTAQGLVGTVSKLGSRTARVTLLTDDQSAVSATILGSQAAGIVRRGQGPRAPLRLVRVPKEAIVQVGDTVVTAGWRSRRFSSLYPPGILIGRVTSVGRADTDLFTQVQLEPFANLSSLEAVLVLVPSDRGTTP